MDVLAASPVQRPQPPRIAPVFDEERTAPATVAATGEDAQPPANPKFSDVVAILNPLQNLPIVGTVYRNLTGDVPHPAARALGGLLWGGPLGLVGAIFSYVAEQVSGKSATDLVTSIFDGTAGATTEVAAQPAPAAGATGAPRSLIPASAAPAAAIAAEPQVEAKRAAVPAASEERPRNAATRDLAFYQAHAGTRMPPTGQQSRETPMQARGDFMQLMTRGIDRYTAQARSLEAQSRTPVLDRVE